MTILQTKWNVMAKEEDYELFKNTWQVHADKIYDSKYWKDMWLSMLMSNSTYYKKKYWLKTVRTLDKRKWILGKDLKDFLDKKMGLD